MCILTLLVRPYRCMECKQFSIAFEEEQKKDSAQGVLSFEDMIEKKRQEKKIMMGKSDPRKRRNAIVVPIASQGAPTSVSRLQTKGSKWWEEEVYDTGVKKMLNEARNLCRRCCSSCKKKCRFKEKGELEEMQEWELCWHMSNTDKLHISFFMIQVYVLVFGLVFTLNNSTDQNSLFDTNFTWMDGVSISIMVFLIYPFFSTLLVTWKAYKATKKEKKLTQKIEKVGCCGKFSKKIFKT